MTQSRLKARARSLPIILGALVAVACSTRSGSQLTYVGPTVEGVRDIWISDPTGTDRSRLLTGIGGLGEGFFWLPDGERAIVYQEAEAEYFVADIDSGEIQDCLTCDFDAFSRPELSPDGDQIAWPARDGIYLLDSADFAVSKLVAVERPGWLSWSPDGRSLAYAARDRRLQLYRVDVEDGQITQLTESDGEVSTENFAPAWSPRRDQIAFHSLDREGHRIMLMAADGSDLRILTDWSFSGEIYDPGLQRPPVWSPDGDQLVFSQASALGDTDIFVILADGTGLRNLSNSPGNDWDPAWSPDGAYIAFVSNRDGDREIYVMNADGSEPRNVSRSPTTAEMNPTWKP